MVNRRFIKGAIENRLRNDTGVRYGKRYIPGVGACVTTLKSLSGVSGTASHHKYVHLFGCGECMFWGKDLCPHGIGKVLHPRTTNYHNKGDIVQQHSNGICQEHIKWIKNIFPNNIDIMKVRHLYNLMELQKWASGYIRKLELEGNDADTLLVRKLVLDKYFELVKHDEGNKVTIERTLSPIDIAKMIDIVVEDEKE